LGPAPARAQVAKYYPDNTLAVVVVDLDRVRQSAAARHILGKKTIVQFARDWVQEAQPGVKSENPDAWERFVAAAHSVDRLVEKTTRLTVTAHSRPAKPASGFPLFLPPLDLLVLCEGKYDGDRLLKDLKAAAQAVEVAVKVETFGDHQIITAGEKDRGLCLTLLDNSVLAMTLPEGRASLEAAISRAEGKSRPNPTEEFAALLKQLPKDRALAAAVPGDTVVSVDLGESGIRLEAAFTPTLEDQAKKLELTALTTVREVANVLGEKKLPLARHVKAATVERSGKRVTVKITVPAEVAAATLRELARQIAKGAAPAPEPPASVPKDDPALRALAFKGLRDRPSVAGVAVSPDGRTVAAVTSYELENRPFSMTAIGPGKLVVWDVATRRPVLEHSLGNAPGEKQYFGGTGLAFHPNNRLLLVSIKPSGWFTEGIVVVWDVQQRREVRRVPGIGANLSPDGRLLATYSSGGLLGSPSIGLVDTQTWQSLRRVSAPHGGGPLTFTPDGSHLAGSFIFSDGKQQKNELSVWATGNGALVRTISFPGLLGVGHFAWDADGAKLAVSRPSDGTVRIWDWQQGAEIRKVALGRSGTLRPDAANLAAVSGVGEVKLLDVAGGEAVTLRAPGASFQYLAFRPDGRALVAAARDGTVYLWPLK
jgi:WD40 repeat protein